MGYNNIEEVSIAIGSIEETVRLIRKALLPSVWSGKHITRENNPSTYRNVLIKEEIDGEYNFYVSVDTAPEGQESTWEWIQISSTSGTTSGGTKTHIVEIYGDLDDINNPQDGTLAIVRTENNIYYYDIDSEEWKLLGGDKDYRIVETLGDLNSIEDPYEGLLVYVDTLYTEYRYVGGEWVIKDFQTNDTIATDPKDWYVSPDGDDLVGDGSELNPWETIEKALLSIPSIHLARQTIHLMAGNYEEFTYTIDHNINRIIKNLTFVKAMRFFGEIVLVDDSYTATGTTKPNNPTAISLDNGREFDEDNQYLGYFLGRDATSWYPIGPHKKDEVVFSQFAPGFIKMNTGVWKTKTKVIIDELMPATIGNVNINFHTMKLHFNRGNQNGSSSNTQLQRCIITTEKNDTISSTGSRIRFSNSLLISENTNKAAIRVSNVGDIELNNLMIYNLNPEESRNSAIEFENGLTEINTVMIEGFAYAYTILGNTSLHHSSGYHVPVVNNCGVLFQIKGSGFQWSMGSNELNAFPYPRMYLNDVNYLFALNAGVETILNNINVNLSDGYLQNELDVIQSFVTSDSRTWQGGENLTNIALSAIPKNLIDLERNINIVYPESFANIETMFLKIEPDETPNKKIKIGRQYINKSIKIEYTATREFDTQVGTLYLTTDKKFNPEYNSYYIYEENMFDEIGIFFGKDVDNFGDEQYIFLNIYVDDRDENPVELEMNITRIQKDPSGWFYIPLP